MFENPPAFNAALQTFLAGDEPAAEPVTLGAAAPTRRQRWRDAYALRKRRRRERRDDRRSVEVDDDHE
jgi:hypothetical protein